MNCIRRYLWTINVLNVIGVYCNRFDLQYIMQDPSSVQCSPMFIFRGWNNSQSWHTNPTDWIWWLRFDFSIYWTIHYPSTNNNIIVVTHWLEWEYNMNKNILTWLTDFTQCARVARQAGTGETVHPINTMSTVLTRLWTTFVDIWNNNVVFLLYSSYSEVCGCRLRHHILMYTVQVLYYCNNHYKIIVYLTIQIT